MDLGADIPITLIVKAPNQRIADHPVECMMGWTIRKLKEHLENVYPSKPRHNQQKLIYSGRLLDDHLTLKEVLRQNDAGSSHHTVHLVCAPTSEGYASSPHSSTSQTPAAPAPTSSATTMPASSPLSQEGLRHRGYAMPPVQPPAGVPPMMPMGTVPGFPYTAYHPQHLYLMQQQMYAQYMQYMQQYQMAAANLPAAATLPNAPAPAPAAAAANADAAAGNQNMRMNAQGGMVDEEDEDEMNRDWLDYLYVFFRFVVLVSIVYFYSNFSRFLAVGLGCLTFYMLQRLWPRVQEAQRAYLREARVAAEEAREANAPADNAAAPATHNNNDPAQDNSSASDISSASQAAEEEGTDETPGANEQQQQQQQEQPKPNPFLVIYTFITTFFTSLIPEQPEPVHLN